VATVEANGQTLYYEVHGEEGDPLLCVMGLSGRTNAWTLQVSPFSERHRTVVFDNRDAGRSSRAAEPYEIRDMAADALALADALELGRFHLLGVSMGGAISQEIALAAPERVRTLTLAVTYARWGAWGRSHAAAWSARRLKQTHEEHVDEMMLSNFSETFFENAEVVAYVREEMLSEPRQPAEAFVRQLSASRRHDAAERVPSLSMPVQVIAAERDLQVPVWKALELAELIPNAKLTLLEGSPHAANVERAEDFNRAVLDFIGEHAGARPAAA
jgi:3-oxoadipate enol-lactonase